MTTYAIHIQHSVPQCIPCFSSAQYSPVTALLQILDLTNQHVVGLEEPQQDFEAAPPIPDFCQNFPQGRNSFLPDDQEVFHEKIN